MEDSPNSQLYRIVVVDDDPNIRYLLREFLEARGYHVELLEDGEDASWYLRAPMGTQLVLLDLSMPGLNGLEVLRLMREEDIATPVIVISASADVDDRVRALQAGATDYLVKPFDPDELLVRIRAILRRTLDPAQAPMQVYRFGDYLVNYSTYEVFRQGKMVELSLHELELLRYLLQNKGRTITPNEVLEKVFRTSGDVALRSIDRHIASLRQKLHPAPNLPPFIESLRHEGYRFRPDIPVR